MRNRPLKSGRSKGRERLAAVLRATRGVVQVEDVVTTLGLDRQTSAKLLSRWSDQGWLRRIRRGIYAPLPIDAAPTARTVANPWLLIPTLFGQSYVGGWSSAEHWGLTEQIFRDICVFTSTRFRSKQVEAEGTRFVLYKLPANQFFGTRTVWESGTRIHVADPHRTIVDMLAWPSAGPGMAHAAACLAAYLRSKERNLPKLIEYADAIGRGVVFKRLGFLLDSMKADPKVIEECRARLSAGYSKLDPALAAERLVTPWRLWLPSKWEMPRDRSA